MKYRYPKLILVLIAFLCFFSDVKADHMVGSDITYQCISTNRFLVTFKVYRDCSGIPWCICPGFGTSYACPPTINILGADQSCPNTNFGTTQLPLVQSASGFDIIQLCGQQGSGNTSVCTNCGTRTAGSFTPGIEIYTFSGIVALSSLPSSCCKVKFYFLSCCRNAAITTLVNPTGLNFYIEAMVDRCATPCNSGPSFTNDPVAVACAGQDFTYNLGAIDPDGDSLSYSFAPSLVGIGAPAPYSPPYSSAVPFPYLGMPAQSPPALPPLGIFIDPYSGDIRFRPMGTFVSNLVVEVSQWRMVNGVPTKIGVTRRDLQFYSMNCPPNNPPRLLTRDYNSGALTTPDQPQITWAVCANQQLCFIITAWDDPGDTTNITWNAPNNLITRGATFTPIYNPALRFAQGPRLDSFKFCWTPPRSEEHQPEL